MKPYILLLTTLCSLLPENTLAALQINNKINNHPNPAAKQLQRRDDGVVSEPLTTASLTPATSGFTVPSTETSTPTETATITVSTASTTNTTSLPSATTTNTAGSIGTTASATQSLSGGTNTATGTSSSATGAAGTIGDGREGSTVALVVAIGVGLVGWVGL